jgi:hypothetical protein
VDFYVSVGSKGIAGAILAECSLTQEEPPVGFEGLRRKKRAADMACRSSDADLYTSILSDQYRNQGKVLAGRRTAGHASRHGVAGRGE